MNVDDFLNTELNKKDSDNLSDSLDLSGEDVSLDSVSKTSDVQDNDKTSQKDLVDSGVKNSEKELSGTFSERAKLIISTINSTLRDSNIISAMEAYSDLILLSKEVPSIKIDFKNKLNLELSNLHLQIQKKLEEMKKEFEDNVSLLESLNKKLNSTIRGNKYDESIRLYAQLIGVYKNLPDEFSDKKILIYRTILNTRSSLNTLKYQFLEKDYISKKSKIINIISNMVRLINESRHEEALIQYEIAEKIYFSMPKGFLENKVQLFSDLLKKKNTAELSLQIKTLQNELTEKGVEVSTLQKSLEEDSVKKSVDKINEESNLSENVNSGIPSNSFTPEKNIENNNLSLDVISNKPSDSLSEAIKDIKIARAKIDIIDGNLSNAKKILFELLKEFPESSDVLNLIEEMKHSLPEKQKKDLLKGKENLLKVSRELENGDLDSAEIDEDLFEKSEAFNSIEKKTREKLSGDFKNAIIRKRLDLAKKNVRQGNLDVAKSHIKKILEKYPESPEAQELLNKIKSNE